jgi:hypothetical protein
MRKFKYKGNGCALGRFGFTSKGDTLELTETEASSVSQNSNFVSLREPPQDDIPIDIVPQAGQYFDLRDLPWGDKSIYRAVLSLKRKKVMNALLQMESLGFPVPCIDRAQVSDMQDKLLELGRKAGWL